MPPTPHHLLCPITLERLVDPVVAPDGHVFERQAIVDALRACPGRNPLTNLPYPANTPDVSLWPPARWVADATEHHLAQRARHLAPPVDLVELLVAGAKRPPSAPATPSAASPAASSAPSAPPWPTSPLAASPAAPVPRPARQNWQVAEIPPWRPRDADLRAPVAAPAHPRRERVRPAPAARPSHRPAAAAGRPPPRATRRRPARPPAPGPSSAPPASPSCLPQHWRLTLWDCFGFFCCVAAKDRRNWSEEWAAHH